jgi:hypothetical protein
MPPRLRTGADGGISPAASAPCCSPPAVPPAELRARGGGAAATRSRRERRRTASKRRHNEMVAAHVRAREPRPEPSLDDGVAYRDARTPARRRTPLPGEHRGRRQRRSSTCTTGSAHHRRRARLRPRAARRGTVRRCRRRRSGRASGSAGRGCRPSWESSSRGPDGDCDSRRSPGPASPASGQQCPARRPHQIAAVGPGRTHPVC